MNHESKSIFQSKSFWNGALALLVGLAPFLGYELDMTPEQKERILSAVLALVGAAGVLFRLVTDKPVHIKKK